MASDTPNNIRRLREDQGLSQEKLGAMVGEDVTGATISRLESGRMGLTLNWMVRIAAALKIPVQDLIVDGGGGVRVIPVIGQIAAGNWQDAVNEPIGSIPIPAEAAGPRAFALKPVGDSMNQLVTEEGYVVVDPDQRELLVGKVYAFRNEHGEATFKRYVDAPARLEPCSTNPDNKPILLGSEPLVVIGRVVLAVQPVE